MMSRDSLGDPGWGPASEHDLDRLLASLEIANVQLAGHTVPPGRWLDLAAIDAPGLYYVQAGHGRAVAGATSMALRPLTLVLVPPELALSFGAREDDGSATVARLEGRSAAEASAHTAGVEGDGLVLVGGRIDVAFGDHAGLFAHLDAPIAESFEASDRLGERLCEALDELAADRVAGGAMAQALLTQVIIILLRRCLISMNPWGERLTAAFPRFRRRMD